MYRLDQYAAHCAFAFRLQRREQQRGEQAVCTTAAMLCAQVGINGIVWRQAWRQVEPAPGVYDSSSFEQVLAAIAASRNPHCQLSALNALGGGAAGCFRWEPTVVNTYAAMMKAAALHFNRDPRIEAFIIQESSLGFNGSYSQDLANGGTFTPIAWRDALINISKAISRQLSMATSTKGQR